ncbi:MAG: hypothetical protein JWL90_4619 [Chthoniobacteraceae bacterium]|nr:hypothetical protein [Chthoniobacteraceae bacterium]
MQVRRVNEKTVALTELNVFCCELLHQIGPNAQSDDPAARGRLFSSPTGGKEAEFEMDWHDYVQPELRQIFQSAVEVVENDLFAFPAEDADEEDVTLEIPVNHLEAWIHTLTQARLSLAARHDFQEDEILRMFPADGSSRALALFQMDFYGFLLECFLRELD